MAAEKKRAYLRDKERQIFDHIMGNPNMKRTALAEKLQKEIEWGDKPPEIEVLEKKISRYRRQEPSPEDLPWHLGTFKEYPCSEVGLAAVLGACSFAAEHNASLTIREAKWIGRLSVVAQRMFPTLSDRQLGPMLIAWAFEYANDEIWSELSGEPFNTTKLDRWVATTPQWWPSEGEWDLVASTMLLEKAAYTLVAGGSWVKGNRHARQVLEKWRAAAKITQQWDRSEEEK